MAAPGMTLSEAIQELYGIIIRLRSPAGCPWDRQQTPQTVALYLIEETYELVEAIAAGTSAEVCEELGDVLFQILFIALLYDEKGCFNLEEATRGIANKMIRRHPHVFSTDQVASAADVRQRWHQLKAAEAGGQARPSVLASVPRRLPALIRAYRVLERAARSGVQAAPGPGLPINQVENDWQHLKNLLASASNSDSPPPDSLQTANTFGLMFLHLTDLARQSGVHPENALAEAVRQFEERFKRDEQDHNASVEDAAP